MPISTFYLSQTAPSIALVALMSLILTKLLIPISYKLGLLDHPDHLNKKHSGKIPLIGGVMIYLSVLIGSVAFLELSEQFISIGIICGLVTLVGVLDDRYPLDSVYRLAFQLLAGVSIAGVSDIRLENIGNIFATGEIQLGLLTIPFTAIGIAALCNAYNMTDGIDGLAATHGIISISGLVFLLWNRVPVSEVTLLLFIVVTLLVFLLFNLKLLPFTQTKIFMGDAGSMFLGLSIAIGMIYYTQTDEHILCTSTALWLVAIPLMDMVSTMLRRIMKGQSPFHGDRSHLHHILTRGGLSHRHALQLIAFFSILFAFFGIGFEYLLSPQLQWISFLTFVIMFITYFNLIIRHAWKLTKYLKQESTRKSI